MKIPICTAWFALLVALPASAHVWVVDDDGGPGVDFTDLPPAVAAAIDGDLILIRAGDYSGGFVAKALTLLGEPGARIVASTLYIDGFSSGGLRVVADLEIDGGQIWIQGTQATVVLDGVDVFGAATIPALQIQDFNDDIRVRDCHFETSVGASGPWYGVGATVGIARFEAVDSSFIGGSGTDCAAVPGCNGGWGGHGLASGSTGVEVHLYRCQLAGGAGGQGGSGTFSSGGSGGNGLTLWPLGLSTTFNLVAGHPSHVLAGGPGGPAGPGGTPGAAGLGLKLVNASLRISGVTVLGEDIQGPKIVPVPDDPALWILAPPRPGQVVTFRVQAAPGADVDLLLARVPAFIDVPGSPEDLLVLELRRFPMGIVGPSGVVGFNFTVPTSLPPGFLFWAQAEVTLPSELRYTNSVPLLVRER